MTFVSRSLAVPEGQLDPGVMAGSSACARSHVSSSVCCQRRSIVRCGTNAARARPALLTETHGPDSYGTRRWRLSEWSDRSQRRGRSRSHQQLPGQPSSGRAPALADPNVLLNLVFLLAASSRDVTGLLHWIVKMLGDNPIWIARVRLDTGDLDRRIVIETLQLAQADTSPGEYRAVRDGRLPGSSRRAAPHLLNEGRRPGSVRGARTFDPDPFAGVGTRAPNTRRSECSSIPVWSAGAACCSPQPSFTNTANTTGSSATTPNRSTTASLDAKSSTTHHLVASFLHRVRSDGP